ncbi:6-hydroxymethylpterin diphosphokinase MptE-like protein [Diplocloster hominis]|uniref:6-hydroxymethylpterin diphosphokinase MptE-like protein n=1 Tax=Diplocloster hominis TaxID=3079010 RepID=UPI0031BB3BFC
MNNIKKIIRKLNDNENTREHLMIPIIHIRDKIRDLKNIQFIVKGRENIKSFQNCHPGKRCFIIGNGPSLTPDDLNLIKNEISFGSNRIYDIYPFTDWRPTYYAIQDFFVLDEISSEVEKLEDGAQHRFIISNRKRFICEEMQKDKKNSFFYLDDLCLSDKKKVKFSTNPFKSVANGGTVTYMMIQLAVYMGIKEIYLIGVDHHYTQYLDENGEVDTKLHAENHFKGARPYKQLKGNNITPKNNCFVSTRCYVAANEFAKLHGIKIFNATRGGKLEVFDRVNLDDIVGN